MPETPHPDQKFDVYKRVWMHCEEGLSMTKASMARFVVHCLKNNIQIGDIYAFNARYHGSAVIASVRLRLDQFEAFETETKGILRRPARLHVN